MVNYHVRRQCQGAVSTRRRQEQTQLYLQNNCVRSVVVERKETGTSVEFSKAKIIRRALLIFKYVSTETSICQMKGLVHSFVLILKSRRKLLMWTWWRRLLDVNAVTVPSCQNCFDAYFCYFVHYMWFKVWSQLRKRMIYENVSLRY